MPKLKPSSPSSGKAIATILIVDDDTLFSGSLVVLFQRFGFKVTSVQDGKCALNHLSNHAVEVVITDIFMAECDGLEFLRLVRQMNSRPKVIAMSGAEHGAMPDILRVASQLGADRTIRKPFESEAILQLVDELLD